MSEPRAAGSPDRVGLHSMTGHGVGEASLGDGRVVVEIRAVNHRYLDVRVRLPSELALAAGAVEAAARGSLERGRVDVVARREAAGAGARLDVARARTAFAQLVALRDELAPDAEVPLTMLASVPDLFGAPEELDHEAGERALVTATRRACDAVWAMRRTEGGALGEDVRGRLDELEVELGAIGARVPQVVVEHRERLRGRVAKLLEGTDVDLDPGRLEQEVALVADRADVAEELSRLTSHASQLRALLDAPDGTAGKRLDFLLQEMTREVNTIGSKSADAEIAQRVVEMKTSISRMREQAQNVL